MENFQEVKQAIEDTQNINLLPSPEFRNDSLPATLGLFYSLKELGKNVNLLVENFPERYSFLTKKERLHAPQANFLISIKETEARLSHLFYEKTDQGLNLFLRTNGSLKKEDLSFQSLVQGNFFITVGITAPKKAGLFLKDKSNFIINIDNNLANENYGQINFVKTNSAALSEIVLDFLSLIHKKSINKEAAAALLAGIIQGTSNFQSPGLTAKTFQKVSFLIEKGANFKETICQLYGQTSESSLKIFGKILNKINLSKDKKLGWALLTEQDFCQINAKPSNLTLAFEKLSSGLLPFQNFFILWQAASSPISVWGVFYSPNTSWLEKISANFQGQQKGSGVLFQTEEKDLEKTKDKILKTMQIYE